MRTKKKKKRVSNIFHIIINNNNMLRDTIKKRNKNLYYNLIKYINYVKLVVRYIINMSVIQCSNAILYI